MFYRRKGVFLLVVVIALCGNAVSAVPTKCEPNDEACFLEAVRRVYKKVIAGDPASGLESSDPLLLKLVEADVNGLKYTFYNASFEGLRGCDIQKASYSPPKSEFAMDMVCKLVVTGQYDLKGRLLLLPVEGNGDFTTISYKQLLKLKAKVQQTGSKGTNHLAIKKFSFEFDLLDKIVFDYKNLFNGNKVLSDAIHKLANANYKEIAKDMMPPVLNVALKNLSANFNKYLKTVALEELS